MLINKCKLFSDGSNQDLVKLYLDNVATLDLAALADIGDTKVTSSWWCDLLQKTVTNESLQQLAHAALDKGKTARYTNKFIYQNMTDEDRGRLYKRSIGLRDDQSFCLKDIFPQVAIHVADGEQEKAHAALLLALDDNLNKGGEKWMELDWTISRLQPVPLSIQDDLHQLVLQLRQMLRAGHQQSYIQTRSMREIISGSHYAMLWENGSTDTVQLLHDEYLTSASQDPSQTDTLIFDKGYLDRVLMGIKNKNLDQTFRSKLFDALLGGKFGQADGYKVLPLLKSDLLPDEHFHQMVDYITTRKASGDDTILNISLGEQDSLLEFLKDERLLPEEIAELLKLSKVMMHDYISFPNGVYKHARDLTPDELKKKLNAYTSKLFAVKTDLEITALLCEGNEDLRNERKGSLARHRQPLRALLKNEVLSSTQLEQLTKIFIHSGLNAVISLLEANKNLPASILRQINEIAKAWPKDEMGDHDFKCAHLALIGISLSQQFPPADIIKKQILDYSGGDMLAAHDFGSWDRTAFIPTSMHALIAAMDYQPGDAFELLDTLLAKRPDWGLPVDGQSNPEADASRAKMGLVEVLVNLAMTREIYPAILNGNDLDLNRTSNLLALAVRDCKIEMFDINLLSRMRNSDQFQVLANQLLTNPAFIQNHQQAYEGLIAGVLTRKANECGATTLEIGRKRTML